MINSILLNTANVLYVFCYGVRDVLWLRILAIAAMLLLLPFYANQAEPMVSCMVWQIVFIAINGFWVVVILRERIPPTMTADEQELYESAFKDCCSVKDMLKLISLAQWKEAKAGTKVIDADTKQNELILLHSGRISCQFMENEIIHFHAGSLPVALSYLTQDNPIADCFASTPVRYLSWRRDVLDEIFKSKGELKSALYELMGHDLIRKLIFQHDKVASKQLSVEYV